MQKLFPKYVLKRLFVKSQYLSKNARNVLFFTALILMTFALARPVIEQKEQTLEQEVTPIVVAIDISKSMLAADISPSRLALAKRKLLEVIKHSQHNAVGVLLFAKSAFILSPITQDFVSLNYLVERFDQGLNFDNGSNIHAVIEASRKLFGHYTNKNLLLLTDGANKEDYSEEISLANKNNIAIYTLALATNNPTPIKLEEGFLTDKNNNIVMVKRNEHIKELSLQTNGGYINFSLDNSDITAILNDIETKSAKDQIENKKVKTYTELFYYPLALSLFILLFAFSSLPRKEIAMIILCAMFYPNNAQASLFDFKTIEEANQAYETQAYDKAQQAFKKLSQTNEGHYNYANALYKNSEYKKALEEYKKVVTAEHDLEFKKLHNMGNTYVKLNQLEDAVKMYEKALSIKEDEETKENLKRVKEALQQQNQDNQNKQDNSDNNEQNKQNKQQESSQNSSKQQKQSENQDQKNSQEKQDNKQEENQESQEQQENTKQQSKQKKNQDETQQTTQTNEQELKEEQISDLEEQKWLRKLQQKDTPVLLREIKGKGAEENSSTPW